MQPFICDQHIDSNLSSRKGAMVPRVVLVCLLVCVSLSADLTRVENTSGPEVVEAVVNIIRESCLFADDKRFLRRLAYVESEDGLAPKTYRAGYNGGIWQVDEAAFKETQNNPSLSAQYQIIRSQIGINWPYVTWSDLRKPLYSGVAAALYTLLKGHGSDAVKWKVEEQGNFWSAHFHSGRSATNFTMLAQLLDLGCHVNRLDLVFVVDSSSSLSQDDFERAKYFVDQVASGFQISPTDTQVAMITYSTAVRVEFHLNSYSNFAALSHAIQNVNYHSGSTQTAQAIDKAVTDVFSPVNGARPGVVKVLVVVTDGDSDDPINTRHAAELAHANSIVVFSVGVGGHIHINELNTIATNPDCTHAYQVGSYEEIRFMTEEIQHATCIAPLFINNTYSCEISRCPPIAVVTPPGGVTIETNISCGGMNVYSAFNNPYPNKAQYERMEPSSHSGITQQFFNTTFEETLYINMIDNQGPIFNGSTGCIATITPYTGDKTGTGEIIIKCIQNNVEIPCLPSYFNCTDSRRFPGYCSKENLLACKYRFPHPYDASKFILCDKSGKDYVVSCPPGEVFQADCSTCIGTGDVSTANCHTPLNTCDNDPQNPCTAANIFARKFYFTYPGDKTKYIQCDIWGHPWVRDCRPGMEWVESELTCIVSTNDTFCRYHNPSDPYLHPHTCDPHKFIKCDTNGQSFEMFCQPNYLFLPSSLTCAPIGFPGTENLVYTCNGAYQYYVTSYTQIYTGTTPHYINTGPTVQYTHGSGSPITGYYYSTSLWAAPCTHENVANRQLYFPYAGNRHQYLQCDLNGRMYLQDCSSYGRDYYEPYTHTCVDGPVVPEPNIGGFG